MATPRQMEFDEELAGRRAFALYEKLKKRMTARAARISTLAAEQEADDDRLSALEDEWGFS